MRAVYKALGTGLLAMATVAGVVTVPASAATTAASGDSAASAASPGSGFSYGSDSWPIPIVNRAPYQEPVIGSNYGGYIGMAGNWARTEGCRTGNMLAWTPVNAGQANANYRRYHIGVGTGLYWYMGGPGVDPHWNNTATEAYRWGERQASWALAVSRHDYAPYAVMWADIEMPEIAPARDNGWNSVYTSPCSGVAKRYYVPVAIDRAVFNGFAAYVTSHSKYKVGVYSSPQVWASIFGAGPDSRIPNTYEWTYWPETRNLSAAPSGWCLRGSRTCAQFFGGQTSASKYALMWQWSGGGGVTNGHGDFDQIDVARMR
ncbi:MAG: hypothetical protein ACRDNS_32970 [Trebonia sp.]